MSEQIRAIGAIGGVTSRGIVDWYHQYQPFERTPTAKLPSERGRGVREGVPADAVELSVQPETIRELPPTMYLKFMVNEADGRVIIQVIDTATDEILRVVPPAKLHETLRGLGS